MVLKIAVELQGEVLMVTASGSVTSDAAVRLLKQVCDVAVEKRVNKILVNMLSVVGELSASDRYQIAVQIVAYLKQRRMNPRLAFVGKPPTADGFGVTVAQNRDVTTAMFSSQQEAMNWLSAWPS
jgi:hypothetical protein